jgi:predicted nuclease of restriction endonuclease-like (RecB) superfamily
MKAFDFKTLARLICEAHQELTSQAGRAVNMSLTLRNWLIGCYIQEYEQNGSDRARYGQKLLDSLAEQLKPYKISRTEARELRRYRQFYQIYPQIRETVSPKLQTGLPLPFDLANIQKRKALSPMSGNDLVSRLSFSHIMELLRCEDDTKRTFYEVECIRGNWSVRELRRQINSLYYERAGLSVNKAKLSDVTQAAAERDGGTLDIRDPYIFEFLGLRPRDVMSESHLEDQLLDNLQDFLLELGNGFCFEARQKRILIGETHKFIDLVFYHRILKCHVLIELKLKEFNHENIGQLNTYVSWYDKNMRGKDDNPPVGILLCTEKDHELVEYALAGMDNQLFISKYLLELPKKEEMENFIRELKKKLLE